MKVTIENKKGLNKDLKIFIDKETMNAHMESLSTEDQKKIYQYISKAIQEKYKHEL